MIGLASRRRPPKLAVYVSDSFDRADSSSSLGSTDSASGGAVRAWTTSGSTFGISSNKAYVSASSSDGYATVDAAATDVDVRVTVSNVPASSKNIGVVGRFADSNNFYLAQANTGGTYQLFKRVGGTFTAIGSSLSIPNLAAGDELGLRCQGRIISALVNGALAIVAVDTSLTSGTKVGIREDGNTSWRLDNFRATAIAPHAFARSTTGVVLRGTGWESSDVANPNVQWLDGQWVMNYSGYSGTQWHEGLAYSSDLRTWTKEAANPILSPISGEGYIAANGSIVKKGSTYYLYYQTQDAYAQIRCATASALTGPWTRQGVVIDKGAGGSYDATLVADPYARLMADGVTIELFYNGQGTVRAACRATATDGLTFTKNGTVLFSRTPFAQTDFGEPWAVRDGSNLHIFVDGAQTSGVRSITEAVSTDGGTTWSYRPLRLPKGASGSFDDVQVFDSSAVLVDSTLFLFYAGARVASANEGMGSDIGLAIAPWPGAAAW